MKFIDLLFTGPPQADIGQYVQIADDNGQEVSIGSWLHDGVFWRYRIPVELVPRMVMPEGAEGGSAASDRWVDNAARTYATELRKGLKEPIELQPRGVRHAGGVSPRDRLKQRLADTASQKHDRPPAPPVVPADWEKCPNCEKHFNPAEDELVPCPKCSEDRCTAICLPDINLPCLDCQAQAAGAEEHADDDGESAQAQAEADVPQNFFGARLFDGAPPKVANSQSDEDDS